LRISEYSKQFFYLLDAQAKKRLPILILAFLLSSMLDVAGVALVGIFLALLTNPSLFLQKIPHFFVFLQSLSEKKLIIIFGLLVVCAFIIKAVLTLVIQTRIVLFCQSLSVRLKSRMMTAYQFAPYSYHLQKNSAYLISRIQDNINNHITNVLMPVLNLLSSGLIVFCILGFLSILHPLVTSFLAVMFFLVGLIFDLFVKRRMSHLSKIVALSNAEMIKSIHHGLRGLTEVRVLGREYYFLDMLNKVSRKYADSVGVLIALQQVPRFLIENMIAIFVVGLSVGGIAVGLPMANVVAMVGMFAAAGARLLPTVTQILGCINQFRGYSYQTKLVYDDLIELEILTDSAQKNKSFLTKDKTKLAFCSFQLNNVSYNYPQSNHPALNNVSITLSRSQSIGLIGPSGAGKSTLVNLILGFLEPQRGQLLVDQKPVKNLREWLNNFAYIPQSIFLLDDTLRRNVALGVVDEDINEAKVFNAIQMAQLSEVANQLPDGLDTLIGENGVRLSGGQRQRVALARAFYHERDIIIMDEATSSLDNETEKEVINTIKQLKGNKTLIVIAHRLTTVEHCDVLFRLEKGQVTAEGSFQEVVGVTTI